MVESNMANGAEIFINWLALENERDCLQRKEMCSMELQLPDFTKSINLDHSYALVDKNHRYEYIVHCCTVYFPSQK
jgi:hypothetical protein